MEFLLTEEDDLGFRLGDGGQRLAEEAVDEQLSERPALCKLVPTRDARKFALLSFASSVSYLLQTERKQIMLRSALRARHLWALDYDMPYYLWIGLVPSAGKIDDGDCREKKKSMQSGYHVVKVLALLAALEGAKVDVVIYCDMDTMPMRRDVQLTAYLDLAPSASVVASSNPRNAILANSGLMFFRATDFSRQLLEEWWRRRCGFKDQLSLWSALFAMWAPLCPELASTSAEIGLFHNYTIARALALPHLVKIRNSSWPALRGGGVVYNSRRRTRRRLRRSLLPLLGRSSSKSERKSHPGRAKKMAAAHKKEWNCESRSCQYFLRENSCLVEPLLLPNVLLLPVIPFEDEVGKQMPPLQGTGSYGLFCHGSCGNVSRLKEHPVGCARVIRQSRATTLRRRRVDPRVVCEDCPKSECSQCEGVCSETWRRKDDDCASHWYATKIFLIGYRRTGIASIVGALERIGFLPVCSSTSQITKCKVVVVKRTFNVTTLQTFLEDYPEAKFILSSRSDSNVWNASVAHWWRDVGAVAYKNKVLGTPIPGSLRYFRAYRQYNSDVRHLLSTDKERFLDVVIDGPHEDDDVPLMRRLCTFVDPQLLRHGSPLASRCHWPFPHKNANCRLHGHAKGRLHGAECSIH